MPISWKRIHQQIKKMKDKILEFLEILLTIIKSILKFAFMMIASEVLLSTIWLIIWFIIKILFPTLLRLGII